MTGEVRVAEAKEIALAVVQRRGVDPSQLGRVVQQGCGVVWDFVRAHGLSAGRNVAVYRNAQIDLDVGVELPGDFTPSGEVIRSATPSGLVASVTHLGPYDTLREGYDAIRAWCRANGYRTAGACWEIYGHWQPEWNADASRIRTDVCWQVVADRP